MAYVILYLVLFCIQGAVWGWAVNKVVENKGYQEDWFWWGFFFGFLALIVALTKPDPPRVSDNGSSYLGDTSFIVGKGFGMGRQNSHSSRQCCTVHPAAN